MESSIEEFLERQLARELFPRETTELPPRDALLGETQYADFLGPASHVDAYL